MIKVRKTESESRDRFNRFVYTIGSIQIVLESTENTMSELAKIVTDEVDSKVKKIGADKILENSVMDDYNDDSDDSTTEDDEGHRPKSVKKNIKPKVSIVTMFG